MVSGHQFTDSSFYRLRDFLDTKVDQYNRLDFIESDPIVIPHQFSLQQDREIMGFWAAMLAWGRRTTIINKSKELICLMDGAPFDFIKNHQEADLKRFIGFKHRTFNDIDALYFITFFKQHYQESDTLETAFFPQGKNAQSMWGVERALNHFRQTFFAIADFPKRTQKHVSSPLQKSTCKRLTMFLRWMVRADDRGVDFGIWKRIKPAALVCPCDVHVDRVARRLGLILRKQTDWLTAMELTQHLSQLDPVDPVKYDFALFGLGVEGKF
ncbi:MAG: TIGR02757 family protein [Sphingobacteriaceae bacterium]|nr:MAG: TIGR02757 family protein [Pedobacter sp.]